jgi:pimeloyl-ACP methyl ester carboxylesterase
MPVLLIGGTKDPLLYWGEIEKAYQSLPNKESKLVKIDGGSHILMLEKAYYKRFQREVLYFLRK